MHPGGVNVKNKRQIWRYGYFQYNCFPLINFTYLLFSSYEYEN